MSGSGELPQSTVRRGDVGVISFAKLVAAVMAAMCPLLIVAGIWIDGKIDKSRSAQNELNRDIFITRREFDASNRVTEEKLREINEEQKRARELQEKMAVKIGVQP